ncbi:hypothetical protein WP50_23215 [Lactiplantibacillus plantarum]|nr:hypothetical protein WP50_23215 [Lactiplantibacillus plantarum]
MALPPVLFAKHTDRFNNATSIEMLILGAIALISYVVWAAWQKERAVVPLHLFKFASFDGLRVQQ